MAARRQATDAILTIFTTRILLTTMLSLSGDLSAITTRMPRNPGQRISPGKK